MGREEMRTELALWKLLAKQPLRESRIICRDNIKIDLNLVITF